MYKLSTNFLVLRIFYNSKYISPFLKNIFSLHNVVLMFMLIKGSCKFRSGKVCPVKSVKTWLLMPWHKAFCSASIKEVLKGRKITNVLFKTMVSITLIQSFLRKSLPEDQNSLVLLTELLTLFYMGF